MMNLATRLFSGSLLVACSLALSGAATAEEVKPGDTVIRNGLLVDGSGRKPEPADVLIREDRIVAIDKFSGGLPAGVTIIDATGKVVSPGFIDTHSHANPAREPELHNFLAMGVTSICLGQDGSSERVAEMPTWFADMQSTVPGTNVIPFVGHGTIRNEAGVKLSRQVDSDGITSMTSLVERALQLGCWGMTTGLEYQPGMFAEKHELAAVAGPVGKRNLVIMSHIRNEDDDQLSSSIKELIEQCRASGARAHVSHIKSVYGKGAQRAEQILRELSTARDSGVRVTADIYPYTASNTGLGILFPVWALPPNSYQDTLTSRRAELVSYLHQRVAKRNGPQATLLGSGSNAGKTLAQLADEQKKPYAEVLAELGPNGGSASYFVMDEELQSRLLVADGVNICTDGGPNMRHPRGYGSFAKIIRKYVLEDNTLSLEAAIHKMSGLPAQTIGLDKANRGTLKPGNFADVLVFDPGAIKDNASFTYPKELSTGFDVVLVNGKPAVFNGETSDQRHGRLLLRKD